MIKSKLLLRWTSFFTSALLLFSVSVPAQQLQMIPINPEMSYIGRPQGQLPVQTQPAFEQPKERPPLQREPAPEKASEFEQYIAGKTVEINEFQLDILKKMEGITFQYTPQKSSSENIIVPVRIIKIANKIEKESLQQQQSTGLSGKVIKPEQTEHVKTLELAGQPVIVDAGYLIGNREALIGAFRLLDINPPFMVSTDLKQFGYNLFKLPPSTFAPVEKVPVGPDYVIGPGDEIRITIWGKIEGQWDTVVDRDGNISIPKAGVIGVTGLTFKELKDVLQKGLSKYFAGFEMNVSMGSLRTIRGYIIGNAERPGAYTVSSLSTLVTALFEAGGPNKNGSMRDIQLKRNGKTTVHFDMYDFLLYGDKSKDVRLMPEDVLFIPPAGPLVGIAGSVRMPAIYELKGEMTVAQLIEMAGGLNDIAFKGRIQIERIIDNTRQTVFESDVAEAKGLKVQSGDLVKVFAVVQDKRIVKIAGAVHREGEYGFSPGMHIRDLISMSGGLKYFAYNKDAELTRLHITDKGPKTEKIVVNLEKALAGDAEGNLPLKEDDYLLVRTIPEWQLYRMVTISGEVKYAGTYAIKKGERLSSLIERAGGYTDSAYLRGAVFTRGRVQELQQKSMDEMVMRLEKEMIAQSSVQASVAASPEELAAQAAQVQQRQQFIDSLKKLKATGRMSIKLAHYRLLRGSDYDIELEDGDNLVIPMKNSVVNVVGAVMSQGSFVYSDNVDYSQYIEMAGGYSRYADTDNVYVLKADGSARKLSRGFLGWNAFKSRWELSAFGDEVKDIEPGDNIVVPEKLERTAWLREVKDITQILMQMAVTAGVVIKLY